MQRQVAAGAMVNFGQFCRRGVMRLLGWLAAVVLSPINPSPGYSQGAPSVPRAQEREMVSWVVLANTYVDLKLGALRAKLDEIYPGQFLPPRDKGNFVVEGPTAGEFLIKANMPGAAGIFLLHNVPGPYWQFSSFAKSIADSSIQRAALAQRCWLSVDLIRKITNDDDAYRFIEQVLAKLAPSDAAFLVHPSKYVVMPFDENLRARLARGEQILPNP